MGQILNKLSYYCLGTWTQQPNYMGSNLDYPITNWDIYLSKFVKLSLLVLG